MLTGISGSKQVLIASQTAFSLNSPAGAAPSSGRREPSIDGGVLAGDPEEPAVGAHRHVSAQRLDDGDLLAGGQRGRVAGRDGGGRAVPERSCGSWRAGGRQWMAMSIGILA